MELVEQLCNCVRFEVFTAVTMKNSVSWDVTPCRFCVNRRFGGTYRLYLHGRKIRERGTSVSRWQQYVNPEVYLKAMTTTVSFIFSHYDLGLRLFIQPDHHRLDARLLNFIFYYF
jgi:hypothetical protein